MPMRIYSPTATTTTTIKSKNWSEIILICLIHQPATTMPYITEKTLDEATEVVRLLESLMIRKGISEQADLEENEEIFESYPKQRSNDNFGWQQVHTSRWNRQKEISPQFFQVSLHLDGFQQNPALQKIIFPRLLHCWYSFPYPLPILHPILCQRDAQPCWSAL